MVDIENIFVGGDSSGGRAAMFSQIIKDDDKDAKHVKFLQVKIKKEDINMEIKSVLIKDTTREERIRIVQEGLNQCGGACDFCNGCDNLGGGSVDTFYEPYINGEKELRQINEEYKAGMVR